MSTLTIRNLDDRVKQKLRESAAARGVSMEQEARDRLAESFNVARRKPSILEDLRRLGAKPGEPFDLKKISDEMWEEGLR
jgi:plasmid stability protein